MTKKTTEAYRAVFGYINDHILSLRCSVFMMDYERAMQNGLELVVSDINIRHCFFHNKQANVRNAKKLGKEFKTYLQSNDEAKRCFKKMLCLPLLPADKIEAEFQDLKIEVAGFNSQSFKRFTNYYERQWIQRVMI